MKSYAVLALFALAALRCATYEPTPAAEVIEAGPTPPSVDSSTPAPAPGKRRCAAKSAFTSSAPVPGLDAVEPRGTLRLTADELTAVFSQWSAARGAWDLWMATRASTELPFTNAEPVIDANSGDYQRYPTIDADGLTLFFDRFSKEKPSGTGADVFRLNRPEPRGMFTVAHFIEGMPVTAYEPYFGDTPGVVYYTNIDSRVDQWTIGRAQLSGNIVRSTSEFYRTPHGASSPVVSSDEREMYLYIYEAAEIDGGEEYGYPTRVVREGDGPFVESSEGLDLAEGEFTWLSPDSCRLYFTYQDEEEVDGNTAPPSGKLFMLSRTP